MNHFQYVAHFPVPCEVLFDWHERPGAFERLTPGWAKVKVLAASGGIKPGSWVTLRAGPLGGFLWEVVHEAYEAHAFFTDRALKSPFRHWEHRHVFSAAPEGGVYLKEQVAYEMPYGMSRLKPWVEKTLSRTFKARMQRLSDEIRLLGLGLDDKPLVVAITGASGLIGSSLIPLLRLKGHRVRILKRGESLASSGGIYYYDPESGAGLAAALDGVDVVIHLAGEPILGYWTRAKKEAIYQSRIAGTACLVKAITTLTHKPKAFVMASGIGYYGEAIDGVDETGEKDQGFLSDVVRDWELAVDPLVLAGVRVVKVRLGPVLSGKKGLLALMAPLFYLGLGGVVGRPNNRLSWIGIEDVVRIFYYAITQTDWDGVINAVAPQSVTQMVFSKTLADVLKRPCFFNISEKWMRFLGGECAQACCLGNVDVKPQFLLDKGYVFAFSDLRETFIRELG